MEREFLLSFLQYIPVIDYNYEAIIEQALHTGTLRISFIEKISHQSH